MRFDAFMARALFDPWQGYYASGRARIGREGDFYTSVSVGRVFGRVIAAQYAGIWERLGKPPEFHFVEQGANGGALAADVLDALRDHHPECLAATHCTLVEPFPALAAAQAETLAAHAPRVQWVDTLDAIAPFTGMHFTNEYADALPVRLFVKSGDKWRERHVASRDGALEFLDLEMPDPPAILPPEAEDGYVAEARPEATIWISEVARKLVRGAALVVDYGFARDQLYAPWRKAGTLSCYRSHRRDDDPLESPGEKDITAHVDFTALADAGISAGLDLAGFTDQYHFLVGAGTSSLLALETEPPSAERDGDLRGFKALLHPEMMGTQFKYLCLSRGIDLSTPLAGFRHARPAEEALNTSPSETRRETAPAPSNPGR